MILVVNRRFIRWKLPIMFLYVLYVYLKRTIKLIFFLKDEPCVDLNLETGFDVQNFDEDSNVNGDVVVNSVHNNPVPMANVGVKKRGRKFKDEESRKKWEDIMTIKRRKVFTSIIKKEIGKQHRAKINKHKELLILCKRVALQCQKAARQKAVSVQYVYYC